MNFTSACAVKQQGCNRDKVDAFNNTGVMLISGVPQGVEQSVLEGLTWTCKELFTFRAIQMAPFCSSCLEWFQSGETLPSKAPSETDCSTPSSYATSPVLSIKLYNSFATKIICSESQGGQRRPGYVLCWAPYLLFLDYSKSFQIFGEAIFLEKAAHGAMDLVKDPRSSNQPPLIIQTLHVRNRKVTKIGQCWRHR